MTTPDPPPNSLGLDLVDPEPALDVKSTVASPPTPPPQPTTESSPDTTRPDATDATTAATATSTTKADDPLKSNAPKKTPYVNPERVKTGGLPRDKLTAEELAERMARMREQNEKIKQRRLDVAADEDAFKQTQAAERQRQAHMRRVQDTINRTREQSARQKMDKIQTREWDSDKKTEGWLTTTAKSEQPAAPSSASTTWTNTVDSTAETEASPTAKPREDTNRGRGFRGRVRGRGPGRGRGQSRDKDKAPPSGVPVVEKEAAEEK